MSPPRPVSRRLGQAALLCPRWRANGHRAVPLVVAQWFAKARRQAQLAMNRAKSVKYDPFEDPKYALDTDDDDDDDDDEDEE